MVNRYSCLFLSLLFAFSACGNLPTEKKVSLEHQKAQQGEQKEDISHKRVELKECEKAFARCRRMTIVMGGTLIGSLGIWGILNNSFPTGMTKETCTVPDVLANLATNPRLKHIIALFTPIPYSNPSRLTVNDIYVTAAQSGVIFSGITSLYYFCKGCKERFHSGSKFPEEKLTSQIENLNQ